MVAAAAAQSLEVGAKEGRAIDLVGLKPFLKD